MNNLANYTEEYYQRDIAENWFAEYELLRPDELAAVCYTLGLPFGGLEGMKRRKPRHIVSIGCGRGTLEKWFEDHGFKVTGIDPSLGAKKLYQGKVLIDEYQGDGDTIIFCESLEHIPRNEITKILQVVPRGARVVIVNWVDVFPIMAEKDGWDHITTIDKGLYDFISTGWDVLHRYKSHLVMEKI